MEDFGLRYLLGFWSEGSEVRLICGWLSVGDWDESSGAEVEFGWWRRS